MTVGQLERVDHEGRDPLFNTYCDTCTSEKMDYVLGYLSTTERERMENMLNKHQDIFAKSATGLGLSPTLVEHKIETGNAAPIKQPPQIFETRSGRTS